MFNKTQKVREKGPLVVSVFSFLLKKEKETCFSFFSITKPLSMNIKSRIIEGDHKERKRTCTFYFMV